ncbi:MAG: hypothetical protein ACI8X5_000826 [Planctomycetota bacterium]|jgi:hypothetical protein
MPKTEIRLWPGVPDLRALGARNFDDLIGASGALEGEGQGKLVQSGRDSSTLRYPLPGTVTPAGKRASQPRGAGTGFVYLTRWSGGSLREKTAARMTEPRSLSFAARAWNLFCHLREYGVGTAQPLAMGEEPAAIFASRSFLATRELELMQPLTGYLAERTDKDTRRRLAHSLGLMLARIFDARVELSQLRLESIFVARGAPKIACGSPVHGMASRNLPQLALATVHGGRIRDELGPEQSVQLLQHLLNQVDPTWRLARRDLYRVFYYSIGNRISSAERREILKRTLSANSSA